MALFDFYRNVVDVREFTRFVATGVTATIGNLAAVWISRRYFRFEESLLIGLVAGFLISFTLSKLVAFRSRSWHRVHGEMLRFLIVYGSGAMVCWVIGYVAGHRILPPFLHRQQAELVGALFGAATMTLTSYFGHRCFTYRTFGQKPS
jgi:putative flippase GtrA